MEDRGGEKDRKKNGGNKNGEEGKKREIWKKKKALRGRKKRIMED